MKQYKTPWDTRLAMWIAWHLPDEVAYWCAVHVVAYASSTTMMANAEIGKITATGALDAWAKKTRRAHS